MSLNLKIVKDSQWDLFRRPHKDAKLGNKVHERIATSKWDKSIINSLKLQVLCSGEKQIGKWGDGVLRKNRELSRTQM